jgi:hypothetical protein
MEAHMRIRRCGAFPATACTVVLTTISLGACGPDAGPSAASAETSAAAQAALPQSAQAAQIAPAEGAPVSGAKVADSTPADANAVQSVQTSLAADSQQIAPVLSYAPGDADAPADDSRRTPTSSQ